MSGFIAGMVAAVVGGFVLLLVIAAVNDAVRWWKDREMRRWPDHHEWYELDLALRMNVRRDSAAYRAYRKLRYKYGKKTGR